MATPRITIDELPEHVTPDDSDLLVVQDAGVSKKMTLATLRTLSPTPLELHIADTADAHAATAISTTTSGEGIDGVTVQAQLIQLATAVAEDSLLVEDPPGSGLYYGNDLEDGIVVAGLPIGGGIGQALIKTSADDYDADWADIEGGGGGGGTPDAHAASHADGGSDEITVAQSQVTGLSAALTAKADTSAMTTALTAKADTATTISTTAPLAGGGSLAANRTLTVNTFSTGAAGVVPASGGGTTNFLRADGTWATPAGGGGGIAGITVAEAGSALDTDITTLDFGTGFDLTETPENEVNIALDFTEVAIPQASVTNLVADLAACALDTDLSTHAADTTAIHGIADTSVLVTTTQLATKADLTRTINAQTGTTYTLVLGDAGDLVTLSNAATVTLTVPTNASVAFPVGTVVDLARLGAGGVTVAAAGGVTVNATPSLTLRAQYSAATLIKLATDTWLLVGDLT